ncbi:unnamed protein product [Orchesella dallaii]|uniref:Uncharacterized protein n=1 Tax=Orchesella dallaii TaxID=48710 RepID=A0ABP1Q9U2_9HEXA
MTKHSMGGGGAGAHSGRAYGTNNRYANIIIWLLVLFFTTLFTLLFIMCFIHFLKQAHGQIVSREFDNPEATKTIYFLLSFYFFLWMLLYLGGSIFTLVRGQSLSVLQRPGKIILYLLFTILAIITALLCVLDRLYHAWIWSFLSGIIFLYCVNASATITSIVAICSCVCSIDWCFPCSKLKALRNHGHSTNSTVTFLCHRNGGSSSTVNSTPAHKSTTVTASSVNYTSHKTSINDDTDDNDDLTRPATSFNNPCYLLAVSTATDENGILTPETGEGVTQV